MPLGPVSRVGVLRAVGVVVITATVGIAAACSDEDTVDTIPPPWPSSTSSTHGLDEGPTQSTTKPPTTKPPTPPNTPNELHATSGPLISPRS
jgi:cytoskeletal protein RodZ